MKTIQISARISTETKEELDEFVRTRGLKQNRVIDDALRHYLRAARTLPEEGRIPTEIVFSNKSFEEIVRTIKNPGKPSRTLIKLMKGKSIPEDGLH
ncbi:MAG: hypothetical protein HYY16_07825 [Planctomycetes bacterium]|nr:hypothetical protein [Planctomycetota bacterium]